MHSMTLSLSVRLQPTSRASNVVVCSVSLADMKQRKRSKTLNSLQTCAPWCIRVSMGDLIQDTCWGGNQLVLTKEFNLGIIDSDKQICPWPVDLIFQAPYSYLQPSNAEFRLELRCLWQLNFDWRQQAWWKRSGESEVPLYCFFSLASVFYSSFWSCTLTCHRRAKQFAATSQLALKILKFETKWVN